MTICTAAKLRVETHIKGNDAPWIVLSNSILTDLSVWDRQMDALADHWNILRYDQRGHGGSATTPDPLTFDILGQDVVSIMDEIGVAKATYVGLSMGVPTGLSAYRRAPARFNRLIFVDGQAASAPSGAAFWEDRIALARNEGMDTLAEQTAQRWLKSVSQDDERAQALRRMIAATPLDGFVAAASALRAYDYADTLDDIKLPLRLIAGAEDGGIPEAMGRIASRVAGSNLRTIPGCGHIPNFEAPAAFNAALLAALA